MEETVVQLAGSAHSVTLQLQGGRLVVIAPPELEVEVAEVRAQNPRKYKQETNA